MTFFIQLGSVEIQISFQITT